MASTAGGNGFWRTVVVTVWAAGLLLLLNGCQKQTAEQSELELFLDHYEALDADAYADTMRALLKGGGTRAVHANYALGNHYYDGATSEAIAGGGADSMAVVRLDSARACFERAVALDSTFVPAYVNLGSLLDDLSSQFGDGSRRRAERSETLLEAEQMYLKALTYRPDDEKARCNLGSLYMKLPRPAAALEQFRLVLEHNPKSALAHYNLAIMFAEEKIYREAIKEWEAAAKADPEGDIGERSRANIQIVQDLLSSQVPENLKGAEASHDH